MREIDILRNSLQKPTHTHTTDMHIQTHMEVFDLPDN